MKLIEKDLINQGVVRLCLIRSLLNHTYLNGRQGIEGVLQYIKPAFEDSLSSLGVDYQLKSDIQWVVDSIVSQDEIMTKAGGYNKHQESVLSHDYSGTPSSLADNTDALIIATATQYIVEHHSMYLEVESESNPSRTPSHVWVDSTQTSFELNGTKFSVQKFGGLDKTPTMSEALFFKDDALKPVYSEEYNLLELSLIDILLCVACGYNYHKSQQQMYYSTKTTIDVALSSERSALKQLCECIKDFSLDCCDIISISILDFIATARRAFVELSLVNTKSDKLLAASRGWQNKGYAVSFLKSKFLCTDKQADEVYMKLQEMVSACD